MKQSLGNLLRKITQPIHKYRNKPNGWAGLWTIVTLLGMLLVWWQTIDWYRSYLLTEQKLQAAEEVSLRGNTLSAVINRRFSLLRGLNAFVRTSLTQEDFGDQFLIFSSNLYAITSGILNIAAAPGGSIQYIYPPEGNERFIGYNLLDTAQPELKEDVQLALDTEEIILGFPLDYTQAGLGLAARQALYLEDGSFWGLISIVIDIPTLMQDAGLVGETADLDFRLVDTSGELIYETGPIMEQEGIIYRLVLPEEPWQLVGYPKVNWDLTIRNDLLPIQISGLVIVFLVAGLVYATVNRQARLAITVQERTIEIAQINRNLEQRVAARTRELTTLLEVSQNVATIPDVEPLLSLVMDQLRGIIEYQAGSIFLLNPGQDLNLLSYQGPISIDSMPRRWALKDAAHYHAVIENKKPVIIPDTRADTPLALAWRQTASTHLGAVPEYIACWLGIPLTVKRRVIGLLVLHHNQANYYSDQHALLALAFAHQAALAIENARLYEQAQQTAVFRERQRLARELHDSVSQVLYSIALGARTTQTLVNRQFEGEIKTTLAEPVEHIISLAEAGLAEMRALIFELRPESMEVEGLVMALTKQIAAFRARHTIEIESNLCDEPQISLEKKMLLYRVAQESLHNISKHAQAKQVRVGLSYQKGGIIRLLIQDDGVGFNLNAQPAGLGLRSMRERVEEGEGTFSVISSPGSGTSIIVHLPSGNSS